MHGVVVVDKPSGPTSHDVVDAVRRALAVGRAGHTGTLDPFATGVLPVCVGKATRLARFLAAGDKVYLASVRLGFATTTDDLTGQPLAPARPVRIGLDAVRAACRRLVGPLLQVPPAYSAKRVDGERMYRLARAGRAVPRPAVPVTVYAVEVTGFQGDRVDLEVRCSAGTYVRALARDLGELLECGGHLVALRRTRSGPFGLDRAVGWDQLQTRGRTEVVGIDDLLTDLPQVTVGAAGAAALTHGRDLDRRLVVAGFPDAPPERMRVLDGSGALLALVVPRGFGPAPEGTRLEPVLHPDVVLVG